MTVSIAVLHFHSISVVSAPTLPPGKCALNVTDPVTLADDDFSGYYFGAYPNSRIEYQSLTKFVRIRSVCHFLFIFICSIKYLVRKSH